MKKMFLTIAAMAVMMPAMSQQYVVIDNELPIPASEIEKITYEADDHFSVMLLPQQLAYDQKLTLFYAALNLTGLVDSLQAYNDENYKCPEPRTYYYKSHTWSEVATYDRHRFRQFTVFAETDSVFAANGITNIEQLKAYAKQVYDAVYPEDAGVSDPKDRRNSLNRFVAYHILGHGTSYYYLTVFDGESQTGLQRCVNRNLTDIAAWYATLMPHAALKCSYPAAGDESGLYLNRRGLKDGPDKYGKQIRGAKILADGEQGFDHGCFNGYYFHIDRILTYDQQTRDEVLGGERWRVDFKALSPDIMNDAVDLRGNYLQDDPNDKPNETESNGRNIIYDWNSMENVKGDASLEGRFVHRRAHANFWSWQGDEVNVFGDFDISIKLPPLPAGEWEVRLGYCALETRALTKVYFNDEEVIDTLNMRYCYYDADLPFKDQYATTPILDYLLKYYFSVEPREEGGCLVTDLKTGEQMIYTYSYYSLRSLMGSNYVSRFTGTDPATANTVNWTERLLTYREQATKEALSLLPKVLMASPECLHFNPFNGLQYSFADEARSGLLRVPLGRIQSDGKSDNYLRLKSCKESVKGNLSETVLDYFEFVPKAIVDNTEIPED